MIELRPYQQDIVDRVSRSSARSILVVCATGSGKTAIAEALTAQETARGGQTVFLADRQELVLQAHARLGGRVVMGSLGRASSAPSPVTVASVATLARRSEAPDATLVFADEAHLYAADSFKRILSAYRSSGAKVVGLTATPARLDGKGLGELFDEVVEGPPMLELISMGYLVPVRTFAPVGSWWDAAAIRGGDFSPDDLTAAGGVVIPHIAARWRELGGSSRPTLVFAATKRHARELAEEFSGLDTGPAETVTDDTPAAARRSVRARIQSGELRTAVTVGVLGVGFDAPAISCIVDARPTLSWALHLQHGGRGLRPSPETGKRDLLLIDAAGNSLRHGLVTKPFPVSLEGVTRAHRRAVAGLTTCRKCFRVYEPTEPVCPGCGAQRPRVVPRTMKTVDGQLVEMTGAQVYAERTKNDPHVSTLAKYLAMGKERNWKPNAPMVRFFGAFKRWPSRQEIEQAQKAVAQ